MSLASCPFDPGGNPENTFTLGNARFQWMTDRFVRMEWAEDGGFEDRASFMAVHRNLPKVSFRVHSDGRSHVLETDALALRYVEDGKPFHKGNLRAEFRMDGTVVRWWPGKADAKNLGGTIRTLDRCDGDRHRWRERRGTPWQYEKFELPDGLVSRSGWAFVDDSAGIVRTEGPSGRRWMAPRREGERRDGYLLAYGRDYKRALADAACVFGRQPLPPRYVFGYWYSRYWAYTDRELEALVRRFHEMKLPLEVLVIDMDWHLPGWTGYTWDRRYFPDPDAFLRRMKAERLRITLNLHPADGVGPHEAQYEAVAKALGRDPGAGEPIPFDCTDPAYIDAYFRHLHHPEERRGVDFWWMDWQQGTETDVPGLDPLPWLNLLHWEDQEDRRPKQRPLIFSRYGGLGSGRTPLGFSGDTDITWESLAYQPYFTATAGNVLYGYWSHDIGGHHNGLRYSPELYTRWMQWGVYAPILRTHGTQMAESERRAWKYPDPYDELLMDAIRRRYRLVPYLYTEARRCTDTGLSLNRPLYWEHPDAPEAYRARQQLYVGERLLVAPVVRPVSASDGMAPVRVWLPEGEWIDTARGDRLAGGRTLTRRYLLSETPVFVRPGTLLPGQELAERLDGRERSRMTLTAWPGGDGAYELYEDDGETRAYEAGEAVRIPLAQRTTGRNGRSLRIGPAKGGYRTFRPKRSLRLILPMSAPPARVTIGGEPVQPQPSATDAGWSWDGEELGVVIRVPEFDLREGLEIRITPDEAAESAILPGLPGLLARLRRAGELFWNLDRDVIEAVQAPNRIARHPETFCGEMERLRCFLAEWPETLPRRIRNETRESWKTRMKEARALLRATLRERGAADSSS